MQKEEFNSTVYDIVKEIPAGCVVTYGQIARLLGKPQCSRMVGQAMFHAPQGCLIPCHRVVNCQGRLAPQWKEHRALLESENVPFKKNGCVDLKKCVWTEVVF